MHFLETFGHFVDIVDIAKNDLTVPIIPLILKAAALYPIRLRIQFWSCIKYHDSRIINKALTIVRGLADLHQHVLVVC